jgi:hypothetical protein
LEIVGNEEDLLDKGLRLRDIADLVGPQDP